MQHRIKINKKNEWKVKRHGEDGEVWKKDKREHIESLRRKSERTDKRDI